MIRAPIFAFQKATTYYLMFSGIVINWNTLTCRMLNVCICPAPSLVVSYPPPGYVYHSPSLTLSLEAFISASGITSIGWRRLDNAIDPTSNWVLSKKKMGQDKMWVMLNVSSENSEDYEGFYELLVTNPAGETVVATWSVQPACKTPLLCVSSVLLMWVSCTA